MYINHREPKSKKVVQLRKYIVQQDVENLRKQRETREFELFTDQILNSFSHIKTFTGQGNYTLTEFIIGVKNLISLSSTNDFIRYWLKMIIKDKTQAGAEPCIQRLGENIT